MMKKTERQKDDAQPSRDSRDALLCVAKKLFARNGFAGTSIKALTDLAKVNASLVSYHFGGKRGLYRACVANLFSPQASTPARILSPPSSVVEFRLRFTLFLEEMLEIYATDPDALKIVYQDLENEDEMDQSITESVIKLYTAHVEFMKSAEREGLLLEGVDPEAGSSILFSITHQLIRSDHISSKYFGRSIREPGYRKHMIQQIVQIFFDGISPSHARGKA